MTPAVDPRSHTSSNLTLPSLSLSLSPQWVQGHHTKEEGKEQTSGRLRSGPAYIHNALCYFNFHYVVQEDEEEEEEEEEGERSGTSQTSSPEGLKDFMKTTFESLGSEKAADDFFARSPTDPRDLRLSISARFFSQSGK